MHLRDNVTKYANSDEDINSYYNDIIQQNFVYLIYLRRR